MNFGLFRGVSFIVARGFSVASSNNTQIAFPKEIGLMGGDYADQIIYLEDD